MNTLLSEVAERCRQTAASDTPKYRRLMAAIQDTIKSGIVAPGDRLPTEKAIASALPFALGTVQKALNALAAQGILHRNRRSGTFVSDSARPLDDMSQFVFERADGTSVEEILTEIVDISVTHDPGHWASVLGDSADGYVRIARIDHIDLAFRCYVEMHLRADQYSDLLVETSDTLSGRNIRTILDARYGVDVTNLEIAATAAPVSPRAANSLKLKRETTVLRINVTGYDSSAGAIFTQTAFAPSGPYQLKFRSTIR